MISSYEQLKKDLSPLNLYRFDSTTYVDAEIHAFAKILDILSDYCDKLFSEKYPWTATDYGVNNFCELMDISADTQEQKMACLKNIHGTTNSDFKLCDLQKFLDAAQLNNIAVNEIPCENKLIISSKDVVKNPVWSADILRRFLPAHIDIVLQYNGTDWNHKIFETWQTKDDKAQTWKEIDSVYNIIIK